MIIDQVFNNRNLALFISLIFNDVISFIQNAIDNDAAIARSVHSIVLVKRALING